ncbi:fimbrial biogenesis chaperone [Serratia fonticola]
MTEICSIKRTWWLAATLCLLSLAGEAFAGVVIGATRVVVREVRPQTELHLRATGNTTYLVIARVLNLAARSTGDTRDKATGFTVLPPAFVMKGGQERQLRIKSLNDSALPHDRESMMYLMVSSVPEVGEDKNSVQIAIRTWIKLFYRPVALEGVKIPPLTVTREKQGVVMKNVSPFYVSLSGVEIGGDTVSSPGEVEPFGEKILPGCVGVASCELRWMQVGEDNRFTQYNVSLVRSAGRDN